MANRVYPTVLPNPVTPLGYDGADFRALLVDVSGKLLVAPSTLPGINTYNNVLFGFHECYSENGYLANAVAGLNTVTLAVVPAGHGLVLQNVWALNLNNICRIVLNIRVTGLMHCLRDTVTVAALQIIMENTEHVLREGDRVEVYFNGCTLNDDLSWGASGYFFLTA
jgi:hypothetical protein